MGDLFKDRGQGWAADPADQALERGAQERQCAGPVGLAAGIYLPANTRPVAKGGFHRTSVTGSSAPSPEGFSDAPPSW